MTFTFTTEQILFVCGLITAIGGASVYIGKIINKVRKPEEEQNRRIAASEKEIEKIKALIEKDKKNIDGLFIEIHLLMKATNALLAHGIDGNSIDPMKESKDEITNHLINK